MDGSTHSSPCVDVQKHEPWTFHTHTAAHPIICLYGKGALKEQVHQSVGVLCTEVGITLVTSVFLG